MMNVVDTFVEVKLPTKDSFLKIKETLTRIGISSKKDNTLYQSCHILHKQQKYYIVHFKELFMLDGKTANFGPEDVARRNTIVKLLSEWNLIEIVDSDKIDTESSLAQIKIIPYKDKENWNLVPKYSIGNRR
jgi:hypothetical protein